MDGFWSFVLLGGGILALLICGIFVTVIIEERAEMRRWQARWQQSRKADERQIRQRLANRSLQEFPSGTRERILQAGPQFKNYQYLFGRDWFVSWRDDDPQAEYFGVSPGEVITLTDDVEPNGTKAWWDEWDRRRRGVSLPRASQDPIAMAATTPQNRYHEYFQSLEWKTRRKAALDRAGHRCQICNRKTSLQVHHRTYANIYYEAPEDLTVLCADCHQRFHAGGQMPTR